MVLSLQIHMHRPGSDRPETRISLPLSTFEVGRKLIPRRAKEFLDREGIDLDWLTVQAVPDRSPGELMSFEDREIKVVIYLSD